MERHLKAYLFDINVAIDEIYSFFELVPKRFDEYQKNLMLRRAVERNIGIIGEATNKVNKEFPSVINDLPKLKTEVTGLLNSDEDAS